MHANYRQIELQRVETGYKCQALKKSSEKQDGGGGENRTRRKEVDGRIQDLEGKDWSGSRVGFRMAPMDLGRRLIA